MPQRPLRPCRAAGCPAITRNVNGYCDQCIRDGKEKQKHKKVDRFYTLSPWKKVRKMKLNSDPLCERCLGQGITREAKVVDHIIEIDDGGGKLDLGNMQSLCVRCHARKTADERRKREGR